MISSYSASANHKLLKLHGLYLSFIRDWKSPSGVLRKNTNDSMDSDLTGLWSRGFSKKALVAASGRRRRDSVTLDGPEPQPCGPVACVGGQQVSSAG